MNVNDIVNVSIGLSATPASQAKFTVPILLVDHADVPIDKRYRTVTRSSYATALTASTDQANWCAALWGQNYNPAEAYIGRWVSAASASYRVCNNAEDTASVYAALTSTGQLKMNEVGGSTEDINPDFTGDTSMTDVCASIQTVLTGSANYSGYTCALDAYDRVVFTSDNTGASAAAFTIETPAAGVDLSSSTYLGAGFAQAGLDVETLGTALSAILALDNTPFIVCQRGGSIAQVVAFATAVNSLKKVLLLVCNDEDAKDSSATTDFPYQIEALGYNKVHTVYTEHNTDNGAAADQHPDAAIIGEILTRTEATTNFALTPLTGVSKSGLGADGTTVINLTSDERSALDDKGCDYLIKPSTLTHLRNGLSAGGQEMRVMIGKLYLEAKISEGIYGYLVANDIVTFSDDDIQAMKGIITFWGDELVDRKVLEPNYTITMPAASSFSAATKATHSMALSDLGDLDVQIGVNDITVSFTFVV